MLNQQRVLVAINRGEACEVGYPRHRCLMSRNGNAKKVTGTDGRDSGFACHFGYGVDELTLITPCVTPAPSSADKTARSGFESIVMGV